MSREGILGEFPVTIFLFTDVEGSTRLWETEPQRMRIALAAHDAIARRAVERFRGTVVKTTGDGMHAVFGDALDALGATLELQQALADPLTTAGLALRVRCGLHEGLEEARDGDFFGPAVNRAARIMGAAHGGQVLVSKAVAERVRGRLLPPLALRDLGSVRLRDLSGPERVYQLVHPGLRREFPALRSLETTPNNLPQQVTSFIGRERELAEARRLLSGTRLLTLMGAGGLGKTRLALQLAADALDGYDDGVWFVELAPLTDGAMVPQALASALGVREESGRPLVETLAAHVRDRLLLLVLDNCEHLAQACAELFSTLLACGPRLRLLATSREALHVGGETTYAVPALTSPQEHGAQGVAALEALESVRLFVERARSVQPTFRLTDANAAAVASICRKLDGIPLAIELAAARVRSLSVESIAGRLSDRFRLLKGGDRTALPRQQSLRALIDWSYDLLTEPERAVLRRLSVFSGGWTLEAAEAVCADDAVDAADVTDLLAHLVDKSLVIPEPGGTRYRMLETIRQYARERLEQAREKKALRARHLGYFLSFAEQARPALAGAEQGVWLARLDAERENFIAAHRWCDRDPDGVRFGCRLLHAIKPYWFMRGLLGLGLRLSREALARPIANPFDAERGEVLIGAGQLCSFMGRYGEARSFLEDALAAARARGDDRVVAAILQPLSMARLGEGDHEQARDYAVQAVDLARRLGDSRELAGALNALAQLQRSNGDLGTAQRLYLEMVSIVRALGDRESIAIGLLNLAMVAVDQGACAQAQAALREVLQIVHEIDSAPAGQSALEVCAALAVADGDAPSAARFFGAAERRAEQSGLQRDPTDEAFLRAWLQRIEQHLGPARFAAAAAEGRAADYADALAQARAWLEQRVVVND